MTINNPLEAVVPLDQHHDIGGFDCGQADLNLYLQKHALANQKNRSGRTYVVVVPAVSWDTTLWPQVLLNPAARRHG